MLGTTAFEMVSNGVDFKEIFSDSERPGWRGSDSCRDIEEQAGESSARGTFFPLLQSMPPAWAASTLVVPTDEDNAFYILLTHGPQGSSSGSPRASISTTSISPTAHQVVYDESGAQVSDTAIRNRHHPQRDVSGSIDVLPKDDTAWSSGLSTCR